MAIFITILILALISLSNSWADQHLYEAILDNFTIDYIDYSFMDLKAEVVKVNKKNGLNFVFTSKINLQDNTMVAAEGFKAVNGKDYPVLHIRKTLKDAIQMELFDFQTLWVKLCRPPLVWPIQKGVTHRINGWVPNSSKFPPNLPSGKWLIRMTQSFYNGTKCVVLMCYARVEYFNSNKKN